MDMKSAKILMFLLLVSSGMLTCCTQQSAPRAPMISFTPLNIPLRPQSVVQMKRSVNIERDYMSTKSRARKAGRSMSPKFITMHSTQNFTAGARQHARALHNGAMGKLNWHYTVDNSCAVNHVPTNESARHADRGGTGDRYSIGIEMCEVRGESLAVTWDRSARLAAVLMKKYNIPLRNVVPHYYWTKKECPRPLLDHGRPGYKWSWFISRIDYYYRCLNAPANLAVAPNANTGHKVAKNAAPARVTPMPSAPTNRKPSNTPVSLAPRALQDLSRSMDRY